MYQLHETNARIRVPSRACAACGCTFYHLLRSFIFASAGGRPGVLRVLSHWALCCEDATAKLRVMIPMPTHSDKKTGGGGNLNNIVLTASGFIHWAKKKKLANSNDGSRRELCCQQKPRGPSWAGTKSRQMSA